MRNILTATIICIGILNSFFISPSHLIDGGEKDTETGTTSANPKIQPIQYPFADDFENGDISPWAPESLPEDWSTTYVAAPGVRKGLCRRAEIRKEVTIKGRPRAEYTINGSAWAKEQAERWFGVGIFIPEDFDPGTPGKWVNIWHLHATPDFDLGEDWRYGMHHLGVFKEPNSDKLMWAYFYNAQCVEVGKSDDDFFRSPRFDLAEVEKGVWNDFVINMKFAYCEDQKGHLKLWMNSDIDEDTPRLETSGPNSYNDQSGPYVKMGMQTWDFEQMPEWTTPLVIYYDNWRMDNENGTLSSVDPGTRN